MTGSGKATNALLNWKIVHEKLPWGLVLLIGGGFAMASASRESGLSKLIGAQLVNLQDSMSSTAILVVMCTAATFLTEVSSNTAIANIVLPVLAEMVRDSPFTAISQIHQVALTDVMLDSVFGAARPPP